MTQLSENSYFYQAQLKNYILQFMAIFSGLRVQVGKLNDTDERLITVPIHYASSDKVVAAIKTNNTHNALLRLPTMSAWMTGLRIDSSHAHGVGMERRNVYVPVGGLVPNDVTVVHQRMPYPYVMSMQLGLYASNTNQHFQMLEQILPLFEPQLTIQTSDAPLDWKQLVSVELIDVNVDANFPVTDDQRIVQSTLS